MLKSILLIALALVIAIGGGAASVWFSLKSQEGVGAVTVAEWTAFPDIGTPNADPYSKARIAREGVLALGRAEGLTFIAQRDSNGGLLKQECNYRIEGILPVARFWTLYAADQALSPIRTDKRRQPTLQSLEILHQPDNSVAIFVGAHPAPGNWLAVFGSGAMNFVLTFYDTPIASSTGIDGIEMPRIVKADCNV